MLEMGLDTFGDVVVDGHNQLISQAHALRNVITEAVLAEQVGVDCFGVGEHHRADFADCLLPSPARAPSAQLERASCRRRHEIPCRTEVFCAS